LSRGKRRCCVGSARLRLRTCDNPILGGRGGCQGRVPRRHAGPWRHVTLRLVATVSRRRDTTAIWPVSAQSPVRALVSTPSSLPSHGRRANAQDATLCRPDALPLATAPRKAARAQRWCAERRLEARGGGSGRPRRSCCEPPNHGLQEQAWMQQYWRDAGWFTVSRQQS